METDVFVLFKNTAYEDTLGANTSDYTSDTVLNPSNKALTYMNVLAQVKRPAAAPAREANELSSYTDMGDISFIFDREDTPFFYNALEHYTDTTVEYLFNIMDYFVFAGTNVAADLNTGILSVPTKYDLYEPGSVLVSAETINTAKAGTLIDIPEWVAFTANLPNPNTAETDIVHFRVWTYSALDSDFRKNYPVRTMLDVYEIHDLQQIYNGNLTGTNANGISMAADTMAMFRLATDTVLEDNVCSGISLYPLVMYDNAQNLSHLPFGIPYKGPEPTLLEIRTAVREYVLASTIGDAAGWRTRIPELFVTNKFYIVPAWDEVVEGVLGDETRSAIDLSAFQLHVYDVLQILQPEYIDTTSSLIAMTFDAMMGMVIPADNNIDPTLRFADEHPTYKAVDANSSTFTKMEAATQTFAILLADAMFLASGGSASTTEAVTERIEFDKSYQTFVVGTTEFYVMSKVSYLTDIAAP